MCTIAKHLHYKVKGVIKVCGDCATVKIKQKLLHKVAEDRNLNLGKRIYLDLSSQKIPSYGVFREKT